MQQKSMFAAVAVVALFGAFLFFALQKKPRDLGAKKIDPSIEKAAAPSPPAEEVTIAPSTKPLDALPASTSQDISDPNDVPSAEPIGSEPEFFELLNNVNLFNPLSTTLAVERLRKSDATQVAAFFMSTLKATDDKDDSIRSRGRFLAEEWGSDQLFPYWKDLATRASPLHPDEQAYIFSDERTLESTAISIEMQAAISQLGIIANSNDEALAVLKGIVNSPDPKVHSVFYRERAYFAMKEANSQAALVAFKELASNDPLKASLRR